MEDQTMQDLIIEIKKDQQSIIEKKEHLTIQSDEDVQKASEVLTQIKARSKRIEEKRKEYVQPLNDQVKKINKDFKELLVPYLEAETFIKRAIGSYTDIQRLAAEKVLKEEEDQRRKEADEIAKKENISTRKALAQIEKPIIEEKPKTIKTENSKIVTKQVAKFEIIDSEKVPIEYKTVDEKLVRKAVNAGVKRIAGVKIWQKTLVSSYSK